MKTALCALLLILLAGPAAFACEDRWEVGSLASVNEGVVTYHTFLPVGRGGTEDIDYCAELGVSEKGCPTYLCDTDTGTITCATAAETTCYLYRVETCVYVVPTVRELIALAASQCQ